MPSQHFFEKPPQTDEGEEKNNKCSETWGHVNTLTKLLKTYQKGNIFFKNKLCNQEEVWKKKLQEDRQPVNNIQNKNSKINNKMDNSLSNIKRQRQH